MSHIIHDWRPEDPQFWQSQGRAIARRNLWISIPALFLAFAIWQVWSATVIELSSIGFKLTTSQLFWLTAIPSLSGALARACYSFMVPIFGGRRWTTLSTAMLLLPALGIGFAVRDPSTSYFTLVILALLCGFGGGNFSSSMANISFFYPKAEKGTALGLNAGLGNLGISAAQFLIPLVITTGLFGSLAGGPQPWSNGDVTKEIWLQNAGFIWVPLILLAVVAAWFGMNDLSCASASFREQAVIFRRKHNWIMCFIYLGTFGSFLGFSAGFPMLIKSQFPGVNALKFAFFGPLIAALARPLGGWWADKIQSGARITQYVFTGTIIGILGVLLFLPDANGQGGSFWGFFLSFMVLFVMTGLGNGSTFMQIPAIFLSFHKARAARGEISEEQALREAGKDSAAVAGFTGAFAAFGGFFIPMSYGISIARTKHVDAALWGFIAFYLICCLANWWYYLRAQAEAKC